MMGEKPIIGESFGKSVHVKVKEPVSIGRADGRTRLAKLVHDRFECVLLA
jgi:hypothetical protein